MIYVVSKDILAGFKRHIKGSFHFVDLPGGLVCLSGEFHSADREASFLSAGAISLEHICKTNPMTDYPDAVTALSCHGVCSTDSTFSAHTKLKAVHPLL